MSSRLPEPSSPIAPHIVTFVRHKRALNRRYDVEDKVLRMLDCYLNAQGVTNVTEITPALLDAFFLSPDISRYLGIIEKMGGRFSRVFNDRAAPWRLRRDESWDFSGAAATAKKGSRRARGDATYGDALRRRVSCRRGAG